MAVQLMPESAVCLLMVSTVFIEPTLNTCTHLNTPSGSSFMNYLSHLIWWVWLLLSLSFFYFTHTHTQKQEHVLSAAPPPNADRIAAHHTNIAVKKPLTGALTSASRKKKPRHMSSLVLLPLLWEKARVRRTHICRECAFRTLGSHYCMMGFFLLVLIFVSLTLYVCALCLFGWIRSLASFFQSVNCVKSDGWWVLIVCTCFNTVEFVYCAFERCRERLWSWKRGGVA